jgi:hypothetical protein
MATYKGIQGYSVQKLSSDPTASEAEGQLWYNSTSGKFKISVAGAGAWAAGGNINQTRNFGGGLGIQTAGMFVGGVGGGSTGNETETYDGTSWTVKNVINTIRNREGVATQSSITASLIFGGSQPNTAPGYKTETEKFDGTNWTETADLNTARREFGGSAGASDSNALGMSGYTTTYITNVESWNGTSWTETVDVNTARGVGGGGGTSTDALMVGGLNPSFSALTESWNGSAWTEVADLNTARSYFGSAITSNTSGLVFGGDAGPAPAGNDDKTESWNGTSWTELADMGNQREGCKGCGTSALALGFGGYAPGQVTASEEWDDPVYTIKTVTVS